MIWWACCLGSVAGQHVAVNRSMVRQHVMTGRSVAGKV